MASITGVLLGHHRSAPHDWETVSICIADEPSYRLAGAQRLLVDGVNRHFCGLLWSGARHVGRSCRPPDAPKLAVIFLVPALEPSIVNLDGDVLRIVEPHFHSAVD